MEGSRIHKAEVKRKYKVPNNKIPNHKIPNNKVPNDKVPK